MKVTMKTCKLRLTTASDILRLRTLPYMIVSTLLVVSIKVNIISDKNYA